MPATRPPVLARLRPADPPAADRDLLRAFLADRSEPAFAALVRRHGPMVLGVCRRVLGDAHDAEDAFQGTFLVLARKAASVGHPDRLPGWLHTIAVRTATEIRRMRARRRKLELATPERPHANGHTSPEQSELAAILDEELTKLPEHYRTAVVLCELEGRPRKEVAARLKVAEGTLSSRLAKARKLLADRLARRGVAASAAAVGALLAREAPATVPTALAGEAARVALAAAAGQPLAASAAVHAADGVVKALLVGKLKGLACAVAVLVACTGGFLALPGGPRVAAGDGDRPAATEPDPAKLVRQLGSASFAEREAAERQLRALGTKARPALVGGTKDPDAEVARRCEAILKQIREAERQAFLAGKAEPDSAAWKRFKKLVGDTESSRALFAEMMADAGRAERIEKAEADPTKAPDVYAAEVTRVADAGRKSFQQFVGGAAPVGNGPNNPMRAASRQAVPIGDVLAVLFLGTHRPPAGAKDPSASWAFRASFADGAGGAHKAPFRKLVVAWLDRRTDPETIRAGLETALYTGLPEVLPAARRLATDPKLPAPAKGLALLTVANHGAKGDIPLLTACRADQRVSSSYKTPNNEVWDTQVRDVAAAMALHLSGQDFEKFGFEAMEWHVWWLPSNPAPFRGIAHFKTDAARDAALKKAWDWLDKQPKPGDSKPDPEADKLVKQLGSPAFADREAAEKKLRSLGTRARPALLAGMKSPDPEVARRAGEVLTAVRADARDDLVKRFDPTKTEEYDHPVWKHFVAIVGDSRASRELFARIIANPKWLRTLDDAEADPASAGHVYRVGLAEVFRDFNRDPAKTPPWPCDRPEEVAYLLLLGSHPDTPTPAEFVAAEAIPKNLRGTAFLGRGIIFGEEQIIHANGLSLGLEGRIRFFNAPEVVGPAGTDRVFAKLFAAWLVQRDPASPVAPRGLRIAGGHQLREVLPFARRIAANDFEPKREVPPLATITALELVARLGTRADLPLFERHFGDETNVAAADKPRTDEARDYYRPAPVTETTQMRDVALGLALLLYGANPADFGFVVREGTFTRVDGRYTIPGSTQLHLGFKDEAARAAGFKKAKAWLAGQEPNADPKPDPEADKLVKQLGSPAFADREAAERKLRALWPKAKPALRAGLRDADAEVARRCEAILADFRKRDQWERFAKLIGDDAQSRKLFDQIVSDPRTVQLLEAAADDPAKAAELYRARRGELNDLVPNPRTLGHDYVPLADVLGWLYLGTFPDSGGTRQQSGMIRFLDYMHNWEDTALTRALDRGYDPAAAPLKRLIARWLIERRDDDGQWVGLLLALEYDIKEAADAARTFLKLPGRDAQYGPNRGRALLLLAKYATAADIPLLMRFADDSTECFTLWAYSPPPDLPRPRGGLRPVPPGGPTTQLRDIAVAAVLKLRGQDPAKFGWYARAEEVGKIAFGASKLGSARRIGYTRDRVGLETHAFNTDADRTAAHQKAKAFLDKQPKPGAGPVWERLKAIAGDTDASWNLFAEMTADESRAKLLEKVADPAAAPAAMAELARRVKEHADKWTREYLALPANERPYRWADPAEFAGEVAALVFLGTVPATADAGVFASDGPRFYRKPLSSAFIDSGRAPWGPAFTKLFVRWLEVRKTPADLAHGLETANFYAVAGAVPVARRAAADRDAPVVARAAGVILLARFGAASDRAAVEALLGDESVVARVDFAPPGGGKSVRYTTQLRDAALAAALRLAGGDPTDFGFPLPKWHGNPDERWSYHGHFGFPDDESRAAAHKKAKDWLTKQSKPAPKGEKPAAAPAKLMKQLGNDPAANALADAVLEDPHLAKLVEEAAAQPERSGKLYAAELWRLWAKAAFAEKGATEEQYLPTAAEVAVVLLLGGHPSSADALAKEPPDPRSNEGFRATESALFCKSLGVALLDPARRALFGKLLAGWLAARADPWVVALGLGEARRYRVPEVVPLARRVARDAKARPEHRGRALAAAADLGGRSELPLVREFLDDKAECLRFTHDRGAGPTLTVELRDVAAGAALLLSGQNPAAFGFAELAGADLKLREKLRVERFAFPTAEARRAAHAKARGWLDRPRGEQVP